MIVSKLYGGIGNQLYMYAFGLSQARRLNTELKLDIDILLYNPFHYTPYNYELGCFEGVAEEIIPTPTNLKLVEEIKLGNKKIEDSSLLDGYWQGEKMFESVKDELKQRLVFKQKSVALDKFEKINTVSIHARRGDYMNGDYFFDLSSSDYYQKAVEYIRSKVENPMFFIFCSDEKWAREYFNFIPNKVMVTGGTVQSDLQNMSLCKHNIIANSTYSWWGAWLNKNPNKIVIQPRKWVKGRDYETWALTGSVVL